jgi:hypothetical protein
VGSKVYKYVVVENFVVNTWQHMMEDLAARYQQAENMTARNNIAIFGKRY